jgi:hypothetical protein
VTIVCFPAGQLLRPFVLGCSIQSPNHLAGTVTSAGNRPSYLDLAQPPGADSFLTPPLEQAHLPRGAGESPIAHAESGSSELCDGDPCCVFERARLQPRYGRRIDEHLTGQGIIPRLVLDNSYLYSVVVFPRLLRIIGARLSAIEPLSQSDRANFNFCFPD